MVVEDILDELYTLDNSQWCDNVEKILTLLSYPVHLEYSCQWEEFLYVRSEKLRAVNPADRKILSQCKTIASYVMERRLRKIKIFAIEIVNGTKSSRNDTAYEITKLFRKLYGRFVILVFVNGDEIAFTGTSIDRYKRTEVIISEWFGYNNDYEINNKILEIDFSLFVGTSLNTINNEYLWSIARPYVKYRESKMFLIFGCDNPVTYETLVPNQDGDGVVLATMVDREETLKINSTYYPDIYGDDYFVDDSNLEVDSSSDMIDDADDIEFEWTMLEMELAAEADDEGDDFDEYDDEEVEAEDYDEELKGMNPEEMLKYIRGE